MERIKLFIFDVNVLISAFIVGSHTNAKAFDHAENIGRILASRETVSELTDVFLRKKLDKYASLEDRINFLTYFDRQIILWPEPVETIKVCRDPKDNKYLELAVAANASCIVTGDQDLLVLNPFRNIPILTSADFLAQF